MTGTDENASLDDEKAQPQIQPGKPPRDTEPEIEDPELRSGHIGTDAKSSGTDERPNVADER